MPLLLLTQLEIKKIKNKIKNRIIYYAYLSLNNFPKNENHSCQTDKWSIICTCLVKPHSHWQAGEC